MPRLRPAPDDREEQLTVSSSGPSEPEVVVETAPEVEVEVAEPEPKRADASEALHKQIEALRKSEQIVRDQLSRAAQERDEALERARQREMQISQAQKEIYDSQAEAISSALAAAEAAMSKAKLDKKNAIDLQDSAGQVEADEKMALAAADIARLREGKEAAEARAKAPAQQESKDVIDSWGMPEITTKWLKNHREWLSGEKLDELRWYNLQAKRAGLKEHTQEFIEYVEVLMGERQPKEETVDESEPKAKPKAPPVSAPVSRNVPDSSGRRPTSGKMTLTPAEVEAARISGISIEEYAKQKLRRQQMIESGEYGEQR